MDGQKRKRPAARRRRKQPLKFNLYKICIILIIIVGTLLLGNCLHKLWVIREDMQQTLKQEQELREENLRLKNQRDQLQNPDEISHEAREQFGLVKPGEIPYKR